MFCCTSLTALCWVLKTFKNVFKNLTNHLQVILMTAHGVMLKYSETERSETYVTLTVAGKRTFESLYG